MDSGLEQLVGQLQDGLQLTSFDGAPDAGTFSKHNYPNNAIHRMATRVTPRAGSASLHWHESRHG
jgi:hypothetical protein